MSTSMSGSGALRPRVAIPRLRRSNSQSSSLNAKRRVARACTACRSHKIKCSGDNPLCKHCESTGRVCVYIMQRKDRLKIITDKCVQMASLLRGLKGQIKEEESLKIGSLLNEVEEDLAEIPQGPTSPLPDIDEDDLKDSQATFDSRLIQPGEQVDTSSLDLLDENLHQDDRSRATGFVGKNSEVQWLRLLLNHGRWEDVAGSPKEPMVESRAPSAISSQMEPVSLVTFYQDSVNVDLDSYVRPEETLAPQTAERLLSVYINKVHPSFPILSIKAFEDQCHRSFHAFNHGHSTSLNAKWQATLNLVFAIAARYSILIKADWRAGHRDHLVYQARARAYGWNDATLTQHPDLPQIQVAGLLAFYYLSVGQVSRAWVVVGMALRFAQALGLHVRNEDPSASPFKRELMVRTWWSLYSLDRHLSEITGRPSIIVDTSCSVPLPLPLSLEQINIEPDGLGWTRRSGSSSGTRGADANPGSYIKAVATMGIITQSILSGLYSTMTMVRSPVDIQQDIIELGKRLDNWLSSLPTEFNLNVQRSTSPTFFRERMLLGFQFYSARILLTQPCLGGLGRPEGNFQHESFVRQMAIICVDSAKAELDLLPDQPDPSFLMQNGPWWSMVHYLMQPLAAMLLAISYSSLGSQFDTGLAEYVKKAIRWLRSVDDPLAESAYRAALTSFQVVAKRRGLDISELWNEHALAFPTVERGLLNGEGLDLGSFPIMAGGGGVFPTPNVFGTLQSDPMMGSSSFPFPTDFSFSELSDSL